MAELKHIADYLSQELALDRFEDSSLNGLQFEGRGKVEHVAVAVDAGLSVIEEAAERGADLLFVHHGLVWDKPFLLSGTEGRIFRRLFERGLSLYAVHIPLDAHERLGNNFSLARMLGLTEISAAIPHRNAMIGCIGKNSAALPLSEFAARLKALPGAESTVLPLAFGPPVPSRVCIVTGSGASALERAAEDGFDTLITGEPKQFAYHFAKDHSLNVVFGGHYATETIGVMEVGKDLAQRFGVRWELINHPTGI